MLLDFLALVEFRAWIRDSSFTLSCDSAMSECNPLCNTFDAEAARFGIFVIWKDSAHDRNCQTWNAKRRCGATL